MTDLCLVSEEGLLFDGQHAVICNVVTKYRDFSFCLFNLHSISSTFIGEFLERLLFGVKNSISIGPQSGLARFCTKINGAGA